MSSVAKLSVAGGLTALVRQELERLRQSPCTPVLLVGPPGAGKQHTAELLHRLSHQGEAPFSSVDCAALPADVRDSELFGHDFARTPEAVEGRPGLMEMANGGTLFLHEITALPLSTQATLLRFLDDMRLRRLGARSDVVLAVRVVASASREPLELVRAGQFHEDLYRRLGAFRVDVPPLRERQDELADLAQQFVLQFAARMNKSVEGLSEAAQAALRGYAFPGNVRELRTLLERAVMTAKGAWLSVDDLGLGDAAWVAQPPSTGFFHVETASDGVPPPLEAVERAYVHRVLEHTGGKRMAAAHLLGISYPTFLKRLRELDIDKPDSGVRASPTAPLRGALPTSVAR
jgi:two-component system, NtrC family, response regulator AtoC